MRLRPYQQSAVQEIRARVAAGVRRLIVVAPTGSGKTTIAAHIIAKAVERGSRVLFMAHRRELITQAYNNRLIQLGVPENHLGVLMGRDRRWRPGAPVKVASVDTLRNRAKPLADMVFQFERFRICTDTKSYFFVNGTEIDWVDRLMGRHFTFDSPSASSACGCGTSVSFEVNTEESKESDDDGGQC